jgi:carboxyl-terminal processing protease
MSETLARLYSGRLRAGMTRIRRGPIVRVMLVMLVALGMGIGGFAAGYQAMGSQRHEELEDLENYQTLIDVYDLIREYYVDSDNVTDDELIYGAASGMMEAVNDPGHTVFLDPEQTEASNEARSSDFVGIGVSIDTQTLPPRIIEPYPNSPALAAGILPGDELLAVDGVPWDLLPEIDTFLDLIGGDEGTDVEITLRHVDEIEPYTVTITRATIDNVTVTWVMLPENVLWLRISAFNDGTGQEMIAAIEEAKDLGAEAMILDLRGNSGGLVEQEILVEAQFLDVGDVAYIDVDAEGNETPVEIPEEIELSTGETMDLTEGAWRDEPVVVLIDGNTASAGESTAGSLAGNDRAVTIGETTVGLGTTVWTFDLDDGSSAHVSFAYWTTPDGINIWRVGLEPLIEVANEPGAQLLFPTMYPDHEIPEDEFYASEDEQLMTGFEEVLKLVD